MLQQNLRWVIVWELGLVQPTISKEVSTDNDTSKTVIIPLLRLTLNVSVM